MQWALLLLQTTWTKPLASKPSCANYTEYWKATIEEESNTEEWMDSSDETSVNGPFSNDLENFNDITIQYIHILVQMQVLQNYTWDYQSMPH